MKKRPCKYGRRVRGKCPRKATRTARRTTRRSRRAKSWKQRVHAWKKRKAAARRAAGGKSSAKGPKVSFYDLPYERQVRILSKKYPLNKDGEPDRLYADEYQHFVKCPQGGRWIQYTHNCDGSLRKYP